MAEFFNDGEDAHNSTVNSQASAGANDATGFGGSAGGLGFGANDNTGFGSTENPALAASDGSHKSVTQAASTHEDPFGIAAPVAPVARSAQSSATPSPAASQQFDNTQRSTSATSEAIAASRPVIKSAEDSMKESEQRVIVRGRQKAEAEKRAMDARIKAADEKNADGSTQMKKAAGSFMTEVATKRQKEVAAAKAQHRQEQKAHEEHVAKLQRGGHLWEQVAEVVDTSKTNKYAAKSTDRMRNLLTHLKTSPNAPQMTASATEGKGKGRGPQLF
jgi:hypothetical protein